jgi:hypothetical protein
MASIHMITGPLDDERRAEALFGGDVLIFKDVAPGEVPTRRALHASSVAAV